MHLAAQTGRPEWGGDGEDNDGNPGLGLGLALGLCCAGVRPCSEVPYRTYLPLKSPTTHYSTDSLMCSNKVVVIVGCVPTALWMISVSCVVCLWRPERANADGRHKGTLILR